MTRNDAILKIRSKVIELNPALGACRRCGALSGSIGFPECYVGGVQVSVSHAMGHAMSFTDILRTLPVGMYMKTLGEQVRISSEDDRGPVDVVYWELDQELDRQPNETVLFIARALGIL